MMQMLLCWYFTKQTGKMQIFIQDYGISCLLQVYLGFTLSPFPLH